MLPYLYFIKLNKSLKFHNEKHYQKSFKRGKSSSYIC